VCVEKGTGEQPVFTPGNECHLPFKALGGVEGHEGHAVPLQKGVVDASLHGECVQKHGHIIITSTGQVSETCHDPNLSFRFRGQLMTGDGVLQEI
jgi:hypothetical protein